MQICWELVNTHLSQSVTVSEVCKNILLHGIICDAQGRKMSKSLGNVVLPEDLIFGISLEDLNHRAHELLGWAAVQVRTGTDFGWSEEAVPKRNCRVWRRCSSVHSLLSER